MQLPDIFKKTDDFLLKPQSETAGIFGFNLKFFLVLALYAASFMVLISDPFFLVNGTVWYQQGAITLFLAFTVMASLCWEMLIFGAPCGANLLLQITAFLPAGLLSARLFSHASKFPIPTFAEDIIKVVKKTVNELVVKLPAIPDFFIDLFSNWKITILFVLAVLLLSLRFRKPIKIAGIIVMAIIGLTMEIISGSDGYIVTGTLLFGIGLWLQFCRYDQVRVYRNVLDRFDRNPSKDELLFRTTLRIVTEILQNGSISDRQVRSIVQSEYSRIEQYGTLEIDQITQKIVDKMLNELNIVDLQISSGISLLTLKPRMKRLEQNSAILYNVAVFPRLIFILLFSVVWILNPFDMIADSIPFLGALDDTAAGIISFAVLHSSVNQYRKDSNF